MSSCRATNAKVDEAECKREVEYHCANTCIEQHSPPDRPACEVACRKRPLSDWDGTIPACTRGL